MAKEPNFNEMITKLMEQNEALTNALQTAIGAINETGTKSQEKVNTQQKSVTGVQFEKYDEMVENWDSYIECFVAFMDVQGVPLEKRGKTLISSISPKLFTLLKSLISPANPSDKSFDEIRDVLKKHLNPKPLIIPSRHAFLNRKQHEGESISTYLAELRSLAVPCCYNEAMLSTMLRDVFVSGLRNRGMLDRLFEEDDADLDKTLNIALAMEKADIGAREIFGTDKKYAINAVKTSKIQKKWNDHPHTPNKNFDKNNANVCKRCGKTNHKYENCRHKNSICNFCKKKGHLRVVCFKFQNDKKKENYKNVKQLKENESSEPENSETLPIHGIKLERNKMEHREEAKREPIMLNIKLDKKTVNMELDTGAAVSAMSYDNFKKISNKQILPTKLLFKTYKGEVIIPMGYVTINAEYANQCHSVNLYIVKGNVDTIFGREWLYKFKIDWGSIKSLKATELVSDRKSNLSKLLEKYKDIFTDDMGEINNFECKLELKPNVSPVFLKPRTVPFALKERVEKEIENLESNGIIEKIDFSEWATPVVPVVKPDGSIRLCADYSVTLNPNLKVQQHPLPKLEEIFASLSGGKNFSKLDFSKAYLQMKVDSESQKLLTINTHKGLYACKRLMYGINAAPAIWQKYVDSIFQAMDGTKVFMDDARITGPDDKSHFLRLERFFEKCRQHGLKLNLKKCKFFQNEIDFLGHRITEKGLEKTDEKVKAIIQAPPPKNVQEVKSFLGLVQFYGKFCKNLSTLAYPLNNLTKKGIPWKWSTDCHNAFEKIKEEICSEKILMHYDPNLPLILATDASPVGIGAVLSHRLHDGTERPIAFASKTLSQTEQRYSQIDKEALSISWAVKKYYIYLKGRRFTLLTDHKPLVSIFGSKKGLPILTATRLLRYALHLQAFQFDIQYRNTKEHGNADCLSRLPLRSEDLEVKDDISMFQLSQVETLPVTAKQLAKATAQDEELGPIYQALLEGTSLKGKEAEFGLEDGCIMYGQRVCVPKLYQKEVLEELHHGHIGIVKMKAIARSYVYWKNIDQDIEKMAKDCVDCAKYQTNPIKAKVHYWEYPSAPWERIHIDFAGPFFEHMFLLIVDAHSKWLEVYVMKQITATKTIECLRDCFSRFGIPVTLVSDNGAQLTSKEFELFLRNNGIKHKTCAPFNPSSNGQAERYVFTLKQSLRTMRNYPGDIQRKINIFLMQYRKSPNATTGHTPAMLFMKREIRTRIDLLRPNLKGRIEEKLRKDIYAFTDRIFDIGDVVAVRNYNAANAKWTFGTVVNRDGELHYTVNVNGVLTRRHVNQIRDTGNIPVQPEYRSIPGIDEKSRPQNLEVSPEPMAAEIQSSPKPTTPVKPEKRAETSFQSPDVSAKHHQNKTDTFVTTMPRPTHDSSFAELNKTPELRRSKRIRKAPDKLNL